ncbi:MAG: DNA primase [bacterium]|nr:DNA primase [bacterium]
MSYISQEIVNEIRQKNDIVNVVSLYLPLEKRGKNYFGVCPFHDDKNPSMSVSPDLQMYHCFSCKAAGNVFKFVADYEHVSYNEAIKLLGEKVGITVGGNIPKKENPNNKYYEVLDIAKKFYQNNINTSLGTYAKKYLAARSIDSDTIKKFEIGLSHTASSVTKLLLNKEYSIDDLIALGLSNGRTKDIFINRIMFPLYDPSGNVIAFSGRIYNTEDNSKYINTKETPIFKKREIVYNYHNAHKHLLKNDSIIVMEGFMDVIRASTVGIDNCVAIMGTAVTKQQLVLIRKLSNNIILCFDGDEAGEKATVSTIALLEELNIAPKIVRLEDNLDPDEYILKYGKDKFISKISKAFDVLEFKMLILKKNKDMSNINEVSKYIEEVIDEIITINDEILGELKLKQLSKEFDIDYKVLKKQYLTKSKNKVRIKKTVDVVEKQIVRRSKYELAQRSLIYYMLIDEEVINLFENNISYLPVENYRFLANEVVHYYHKYGNIVLADFMSYLIDNNNLFLTLSSIIDDCLKSEYSIEEINDYIKVINEYNINNEIKKLEIKINNEVDPLEQAKLLDKIMEIKGVKV